MPFKPLELAVLTVLIANIKKTGDELVALIQDAAVNAIYFSITNNVAPAQQLYAALNSGTRKDSLLVYLETYGNMTYSKVMKKIMFFNAERKWTPEYAEKVSAAKWNEAKAAPVAKSMYDCEDEVRKFIATMEKQIEKGIAVKTHFFDVVSGAFMAEQLNLRDAQFVGLASRGLDESGDNGDAVFNSLLKQGCDKQRAVGIVSDLGGVLPQGLLTWYENVVAGNMATDEAQQSK